MFIKTLTIQGFKSYRDQTLIEPFSPKHNVVVGRNGSGKSNFFAAIRFVLSDAYTSMSREERQALLHEGVSTQSTLSAFVEIVFDNSDNRFPTGHEEVILRRTIGHKKDEYSLDKKSASKADVMNLLESAGFSRSNPYYIVPQGRITALTNAKDHERLALLKEVAGTKVYEQRRTESLRIMAETSSKRSKINELLEYIESRLAELDEEKEELKEFQEKDKERRCLEYALYHREMEDSVSALEDLDAEQEEDSRNEKTRRAETRLREKEAQNLERQLSDHSAALDSLTQSRAETQADLKDYTKTRTEIECTISDLENSAINLSSKSDLEAELYSLEATIEEKQAELANVIPQWQAAKDQQIAQRHRLDEANARMSTLYAKRGRATKFSSKAERDAYLKTEILSMEKFRSAQQSHLQTLQAGLTTSKHSLAEIEEQLSEQQNRISDGRRKIAQLAEEIAQLKGKQADLQETRKEKWRDDTKIESSLSRAREELQNAERSLAGMMDKDTGMGLRAIDKISETHNIPGIHGPLYRLFKVENEVYNMAVELTAGTSLFHVVVDTDATASQVLEIMLREKTGRVTFMPLNRLKPNVPNLPENESEGTFPLLKKLRYDPVLEKAFQQVFGKTCVCPTLDIGAAYVKSHGVNTITLDGDKVERKGTITGGYHDFKRSRVEAINNLMIRRNKFDEIEKASKDAKDAIARLDLEITQISGKITLNSGKQAQIREDRERQMTLGSRLTNEKEVLVAKTAKLEAEGSDLEAELLQLAAKTQSYSEELGTPLVNGLSSGEETELETLSQSAEQSKLTLVQLTQTVNNLQAQKDAVDIELNERLRRRSQDLRKQIDSIGDSADVASEDELASQKHQLGSIQRTVDGLERELAAADKKTDELNKAIADTRKRLEEVQLRQSESNRAVSKQQKSTERYLAKKQMLTSRKEEFTRNIRDLGVLPEEAFEKYTNEKVEKLVRKLHVVKEGLSKFAHVNKKAFEQYTNFNKQRDALLTRRAELEKSAESIEELVENLDLRKDEAIERTFKQVAKNFEEVFEKLVPAGRGKLIIQRKIDQDEEMDEEDGNAQNSIDNYTGVSIKVSFNSKVDEGLRIQQLSGGQKSLVALATVFAIQKCDPAPFYLFDEIDANLDAQYRTAVAAMIKDLSSTGQFIVTTFRPEMLVTADKFYGVLFNNQKVSSIRAIKREEAQEFVDQEAQAQ
ncbi:RecF/RecN/SMC [Flagelloscypha sp. PMI_526]|nr:RecF/RecN/SMC [Flagelloscypha sp. PMI_526]